MATSQKFSKKGSPHAYIAAQLGGAFDPLPSWFPVLERAGKLRYVGENCDIEVRVITGQWWRVEPGDWVVVQKGGDVWHFEDQDFRRMFSAD